MELGLLGAATSSRQGPAHLCGSVEKGTEGILDDRYRLFEGAGEPAALPQHPLAYVLQAPSRPTGESELRS